MGNNTKYIVNLQLFVFEVIYTWKQCTNNLNLYTDIWRSNFKNFHFIIFFPKTCYSWKSAVFNTYILNGYFSDINICSLEL